MNNDHTEKEQREKTATSLCSSAPLYLFITTILLLSQTNLYAQVPVEIGKSNIRSIALNLNLVGTISPLLSASVSAEMAGKLAAVNVEESQIVKKGQILAELDRATVAMRLAQAKARLLQTETEYERIKKMVEKNLMSLERLQQIETDFALRKADHDLAQLAVDQTKIRAPFNGIIAWRHVDPGEWINTGGKIVDITQTDRVYAITSIPEKHIRHIQKGLLATITCDAYPRESFAGKVHLLIPRADQSSRAFPVKIEVPNADGRLKSGMFARINLAIDRADQVLLVPKDAVVNISGDKYIFTIEQNKAKRIKVKTGRAENAYIEIEGDLSPEAPVIVTGNETLRDGAEVRIMNQN